MGANCSSASHLIPVENAETKSTKYLEPEESHQFQINTCEVNSSTGASSDQQQSNNTPRQPARGWWTMGPQQETMTFQAFKIEENGQILANGADTNGTFIIKGHVEGTELTFTAMKTYPDHDVNLWGQASINEERKAELAAYQSNYASAVPLEELDSFTGEWGFEEGEAEGTFQILII